MFPVPNCLFVLTHDHFLTLVQVCVYDRRGKGWSEGLEYDFVDALLDEPQWSRSNVKFLKELVKVAGLKVPFYYAGMHSGNFFLPPEVRHILIYQQIEK